MNQIHEVLQCYKIAAFAHTSKGFGNPHTTKSAVLFNKHGWDLNFKLMVVWSDLDDAGYIFKEDMNNQQCGTKITCTEESKERKNMLW